MAGKDVEARRGKNRDGKQPQKNAEKRKNGSLHLFQSIVNQSNFTFRKLL